MANLSDLSGLAGAIQAVKGSKTKETKQTDISDEGIQELLQGILSGPGGVKSIGTATRKTGLFNSTTEEDSLSDLYARAATKAELARSPTTVTSVTPGIGVAPLIGTLAASSAVKSLFKGETPFAGITDSLFGGSGSASAASAGADFGLPAGFEVDFGLSSGAGAGAGAGALGGTGNFLTSNALPLGGAFLSGLLGGDSATEPEALALSSLGGFATLGPMGIIAAPVASFLGSLFGGEGSFSLTKGIETGLKSIGDLFGF